MKKICLRTDGVKDGDTMGIFENHHGLNENTEWLELGRCLPTAGECVLLTDGRHVSIGRLDENGVPLNLLYDEQMEMGWPVRWMPLPPLDFHVVPHTTEKRRFSWLRWSAREPFGPIPHRNH